MNIRDETKIKGIRLYSGSFQIPTIFVGSTLLSNVPYVQYEIKKQRIDMNGY